MQLWLINFYFFLLLLTFNEAKHKNYGGMYAQNGQFPFMASLSYDNRKYCGASIIHERWALTAGHCIYGYDTEKYTIRVGTVKLLKSGNKHKVEEVYQHPDFVVTPEGDENNNLEYVVNDIGLIRLASNISFNSRVQPIPLATDAENYYGHSMAKLAGWGSSRWSYGMSHDLRSINVRVLPLNECRKVWTYADKHICTSTQEEQGSCYGDSGSPLVVNGVQIGIDSTSDTYCESLKPDLYTKVASFVPWIKSIMSRYGDVLPDPKRKMVDTPTVELVSLDTLAVNEKYVIGDTYTAEVAKVNETLNSLYMSIDIRKEFPKDTKLVNRIFGAEEGCENYRKILEFSIPVCINDEKYLQYLPKEVTDPTRHGKCFPKGHYDIRNFVDYKFLNLLSAEQRSKIVCFKKESTFSSGSNVLFGIQLNLVKKE